VCGARELVDNGWVNVQTVHEVAVEQARSARTDHAERWTVTGGRDSRLPGTHWMIGSRPALRPEV
jgi:hypothetical protein